MDHEEQRTRVAAALIQVAGRRGLHAVGMRDRAAELHPVLTDEGLPPSRSPDNPDAAENALTSLIQQAQEAGLADSEAGARTGAISLLAMTATMGTSILVGQRRPESAIAVLHHHLDRIFNNGHTLPPVQP